MVHDGAAAVAEFYRVLLFIEKSCMRRLQTQEKASTPKKQMPEQLCDRGRKAWLKLLEKLKENGLPVCHDANKLPLFCFCLDVFVEQFLWQRVNSC